MVVKLKGMVSGQSGACWEVWLTSHVEFQGMGGLCVSLAGGLEVGLDSLGSQPGSAAF